MKPGTSLDQDHEQPVAYDAEGHPLYAHPAASGTSSGAKVATQAVHMSRPVEVGKPFISDATKIKHDHSRQLYPNINLSDGEYVIVAVRRHPIGLAGPLGVAVLLIAIAFSLLFNFDLVAQRLQLSGAAADPAMMILPALLFIILVCLGTYIAYYVYINNKLYMTNECVIEFKQSGLFNHSEHSISLSSIEDASYTQTNLVQQLIGYGSIRLSTVGDETTYKFNYVGHPKDLIDRLNSSVEAFKNGRPVE
jgi:Bacterial PH domain